MNNISEYLDSKPSFFDEPEVAEQKRKVVQQFEDDYEQMMQQEINYDEEEQGYYVNSSVVYDCMPSYFDSNEIRRRKQDEFDIWGIEQHDFERNIPKQQELYAVNLYEKPITQKGDVICGALFNSNVFGNFDVNFILEIQYVFEHINEQNQVVSSHVEVEWEVEILCMGNVYSATTTIQNLLKESEILKITQGKAYMENGKEEKRAYKRYLNERVNAQNIPKKLLYGTTGWITLPNGKKCYLTDKGVIGHPELPVFADVPYQYKWDPMRVGSKEVFDAVLKMRFLCPEKIENTIFLTHFMVLSVMTTIFQELGHGINFVTAMIGATNSQKTSLAMTFGRMFDRTKNAIPDIRFNSTEIAILEKMESYGDSILVVDDFLPYENKKLYFEQMKKSEAIIRSYGDRVPRKRSKTFAKMTGASEFSRVKGCCLITGETFDTNSESSSTRVIQLDFQQGDVDLMLLSSFQNDLMSVPTFLYDFVCYIEQNLDYVKQVIHKEIDVARNHKCFQTGRFNDSLGIFGAETYLFYNYAWQKGFLTKEEVERFRNSDMDKIALLIHKNESYTKIKSPATLIFRALLDSLEKGTVKYKNIKNVVKEEVLYSVIEYDDFLCVLPDTLWMIYSNYCKNKGLDVMYTNGRNLAAPLKKENSLLLKEENGTCRSTHKLAIGISKRFFFIKKQIFKALCGNFDFY